MTSAELERGLGFLLIQGGAAWFFAKLHWMLFKKSESPSREDLMVYTIIYFFVLLPVRWWLLKN